MKLFLVLLFGTPCFCQVQMENFIRSWPTASRGLLVGLVILFILAGAGIAISEALKRAKSAREKQAASWEAFAGLAKKANLNTNDLMLLKRLAGFSGADPAEAVFSQLYLFEKGVEGEIDRCRKDPVLLKNVCDTIASVRKKLGFDPVPAGLQYYSSRELTSGQDISLYLPENPMIKYRSQIEQVSELELRVKRPEFKEGSPAFKQGMGALGLMVSLYKPGDAEYSFKTKILRESPDKHSLALEHVLEMDRKQLRDFVRLEVRSQAKFRFIRSEDKELMKGGTRFTGTIVDISGGGCNLMSAEQYHQNDVVMMSFNFMGEAFYGVKGSVLRIKQNIVSGAPAYYHHLEFQDLENNVRERIIRLIFEKQREEVQWQKTSPYA